MTAVILENHETIFMHESEAITAVAIHVAPLAKAAWKDYRRAWPALIGFELLFKLLQAFVFVPTIATLLAFVLARTGHVAISNWDILDFLATPLGWIYAVVLVTAAVASLLIEQASVMAIVALTGPDRRLNVKHAFSIVVGSIARIARLGAFKSAWLAIAFTPFVVLAFLTYSLLLTGHDLYFYMSTRPAVFWIAGAIIALLTLMAIALGTRLFIRWSFAIPILVFESVSAKEALRESRRRILGKSWSVGSILVGWQVLVLLVGAGTLSLFRYCAEILLDQSHGSPVAVMLALLLTQTGLAAMGTLAAVIGQSILTWRLYLLFSDPTARRAFERAECPPLFETKPPAWCRYIIYLPMLLTIAGIPTLWVELERFRQARPPVKVTAHRGHAKAAPENTLSAIRRAIESGADYAEIDVQQTADGVVVLLHDRDLKRVAGDSRRLTDLGYDQVREMDVGSWFSPKFAGERIPTLAEVMEVARGKIKLNVELKLFGPDQGLTRSVAQMIREKGMEAECLVTSFDPNILAEVRRLAPGVRTGLIVAQAIGDVSQIDVDVLNVRVDHLSDDLLRDAHRRGRHVHVWTVNEPRQMLQQIKRGVDSILTSDPDLLIQVRNDWERLTDGEKLLLSSRLLLGLNP